MRNHTFRNKWQKLLTPNIVSLLTQIHEFKGEQALYTKAKTDILTQLVELAKIQSVEASNKIEGISTTRERLKKIVANKANAIVEEDAQGNRFVPFQSIPAWETATAIDALCSAFDEIQNDADVDPLLIIPMFVLDFLCIHPFHEGNGRMSRLVTLLLLYRAIKVVI